MAVLRGQTTIWNNVATGAAGKSNVAVIGQQTGVSVFVTVSGATTITFLVGPGKNSAGLNAMPDDAEFVSLYKKDGSGVLSLTFAGSGSGAIDLSPFGPQFLRLSSSNNVTATAIVDVVG